MTRKRVWVLLFIVALSLPLATSTAQEGEQRTGFRPDAPPYAIRGPFPVGVMDFTVDGERVLEGTVWYPALNPDELEEAAIYHLGVGEVLPPEWDTYYGRALRDAAPDAQQGPYPLVIWSTESGAQRFMSYYLLEHLASYGFVVSAINAPQNGLLELMGANTEEGAEVSRQGIVNNLFWRPQDVTREIDYVAAMPDLQGIVDSGHVAVVGRSYGGYTGLAVAGARIDQSAWANYCENHPERNCWILSDYAGLMLEAAGLATAPADGLWPSYADPRVKAIVPISTGAFPFGPRSMETVTAAALFIVGTGDTVAPPDEQLAAYESLTNAQKASVLFENADHMASGICPEIWNVPAWYWFCSDSVWDSERVYDLTDHFVTAFLLYELKGDEEAHAALMPEAVSFPGITYEAQGF